MDVTSFLRSDETLPTVRKFLRDRDKTIKGDLDNTPTMKPSSSEAFLALCTVLNQRERRAVTEMHQMEESLSTSILHINNRDSNLTSPPMDSDQSEEGNDLSSSLLTQGLFSHVGYTGLSPTDYTKICSLSYLDRVLP